MFVLSFGTAFAVDETAAGVKEGNAAKTETRIDAGSKVSHVIKKGSTTIIKTLKQERSVRKKALLRITANFTTLGTRAG